MAGGRRRVGHIGLIGMSGAGKSHWSALLAAEGYTRIHCDERIMQRLWQELGRDLLPTDEDAIMDALNAWMGLPHQPWFKEREARYLTLEAQVMAEIDQILTEHDADEPDAPRYVVDMTGSAVYVDWGVLARLCRHLTTIYLRISPQARSEMLAAYIARPRPVIWGNHYHPKPGEIPSETLIRCYPELIAHREQLYESIADVDIPYAEHRRAGLRAEFLLEKI